MKRTIYFFIILAFLSALLTQAGSDPAFADQPHVSATGKHSGLPATPDHSQTIAAVKSFRCEDVTVVPLSECQALVDLYASTNGAGWTTNTNWLSDPDISTWFGITVTEGHVTVIELYGNNVVGVLPDTLDQLPYLIELCLVNNNVSGQIPDSLGNIFALQKLSLGNNAFSGSIPATLSQLSGLVKLSVDNNQLTGTLPESLGDLSLLERLEIHNNAISGELATSLGQLTELEMLIMDNNLLSGRIPLSYANLTKVTAFYFYKTQICEPTEPDLLAWKDQVGDGWHGTELICMDFHHYLPMVCR